MMNDFTVIKHDFTPERYWLETRSGNSIDLNCPDPKLFKVDDIAWSLSHINRFNGHTTAEQPLSVAQHSCWVSTYLIKKTSDPLTALHGLLHDAHEAYIGDLVRPLLQMPEVGVQIRPLQERIQLAILQGLEIPPLTLEIAGLVNDADNQALAIEAEHLIHSGGKEWPLPPIDAIARQVGCEQPMQAWVYREAFLAIFEDLMLQLQEGVRA